MKILIVEDDFVSRKVLLGFLSVYGECDIAVDGEEAIDAVKGALETDAYYALICLDIMMPKMDGHATLKKIRELEEFHKLDIGEGSKIIMTTALSDAKNIMDSFRQQADAYIPKPIIRQKLIQELEYLGLIDNL